MQGLQWVLMGSARFLVGSGGFLLWFLWERNTPTVNRKIFEANSSILGDWALGNHSIKFRQFPDIS